MKKYITVPVSVVAACAGFAAGMLLSGLTHNTVTPDYYYGAFVLGLVFVSVGVYFRGSSTWIVVLSYCLPVFFIGGMAPLLASPNDKGSDRAVICVGVLLVLTLVGKLAYSLIIRAMGRSRH